MVKRVLKMASCTSAFFWGPRVFVRYSGRHVSFVFPLRAVLLSALLRWPFVLFCGFPSPPSPWKRRSLRISNRIRMRRRLKSRTMPTYATGATCTGDCSRPTRRSVGRVRCAPGREWGGWARGEDTGVLRRNSEGDYSKVHLGRARAEVEFGVVLDAARPQWRPCAVSNPLHGRNTVE